MSHTISQDMLQAFVAVAQKRSVTAAADALGLDKSIVSKRVAQLEALLQTTLFSRSTRHIALTAGGESYLECAQRSLAELAAGQERLLDLRQDISGAIRVSAAVSWGKRVLTKALPEFLQLHPRVEVELLLSDDLLDLAQQRIDLALRWTSHSASDLHSTPVAQVTWALWADPEYLSQASPIAEPTDLLRHPCLCYWRERSDDRWTLARVGEGRGKGEQIDITVRGRYHANSPDAVADAALGGLGIALLPSYLSDGPAAEGHLVRVLADWQPITKFGNTVFAVAPPERMLLARNRALLAHLKSVF